jgi:hypothetical protein
MNTVFMTAAAGIGALMGLFGGGHPATSSVPLPRHEPMHMTSTTVSADISCVAAAVATREATLDTAINAETGTISAAYSTRASTLASAYAQTGNDSIRASVKTAWAAFATSVASAHKDWKTAQQGAWTQFRTAVKSCGGNAAAVSDAANATIDASAGGTSD